MKFLFSPRYPLSGLRRLLEDVLQRKHLPIVIGGWSYRAEIYAREVGDSTEVLGVASAEGFARVESCRGDEGIGNSNAVGEGIFFDDACGTGTDRFGKRKNAEVEVSEILLDLAGVEP